MKISCFLHNLRGYDAHIIVNAIKPRHGRVRVLANNDERYISYTVGCITFKDSMQFMPSSLERLVENLQSENFHHTRQYWAMQEGTDKLMDTLIDDNEDESLYESVEFDSEIDPYAPDALPGSAPQRTVEDDPNDYRHHPFVPPKLSEGEQGSLNEKMELVTRKGVSVHQL